MLAGPGSDIADASLRHWCSATFVGAQHRVTLRFTGEDALYRADALAERLPDVAFPLPNHIVVDASIEAVHLNGDEARIMVAVLTIEDW